MRASTRALPRLLALLAASLAQACEPTAVRFRIVDAVDQDPYAGADEVRMALRDRDGATLRTWTFSVDATSGALDALPDGTSMSLIVETLTQGRVLARGRSFPFSLGADLPVPHPDLFLGRLGRVGMPLATTPAIGEPLAITATSYGALVIDASGDVHRFDPHDRAGDGAPSFRTVASYPSSGGLAFIGHSSGRLVGIRGDALDAVLVGEEGAIEASDANHAATLVNHRFGAAMVETTSGVVFVGGSASELDAPGTWVTRLAITGAATHPGIAIESLPSLASPLRDATAVRMEVRGRADCPCERVVLVGGFDGVTNLARILSIDPLGVDAPVEAVLPVPLTGAAAFAISEGVLALAGGRDALGFAVDTVDFFVVRVDGIDPLTPSAPPLFFPRDGAASVVLAPGLALVVGGVDSAGAPSDGAELIEFPGNTLATGSLVAPAASPLAVLLRDRTVLTVDALSIGIYVPPRTD